MRIASRPMAWPYPFPPSSAGSERRGRMAVCLETALEQRVDIARDHAHAVRVVPGEVRGNEIIGNQLRLARLAAARGHDRLDGAGQGSGLEHQRVSHRRS